MSELIGPDRGEAKSNSEAEDEEDGIEGISNSEAEAVAESGIVKFEKSNVAGAALDDAPE